MKGLILAVALLSLPLIAYASEPGGGGGSSGWCYECYDSNHQFTECTDQGTMNQVPCTQCDSAHPCDRVTYFWTCGHCGNATETVGWSVGSQCVLGPGPSSGMQPPDRYWPCSSCSVYGNCPTQYPAKLLGPHLGDEMLRLAQMETGDSLASIITGLQKIMDADAYGNFEDRITRETAGLSEPARSIAVSHLYTTQLRDAAKVHNAAVMSAKARRTLSATPAMLRP